MTTSRDLKVHVKVTNLDALEKHIENLQRLIAEIKKEVDFINNFKPDIQRVPVE